MNRQVGRLIALALAGVLLAACAPQAKQDAVRRIARAAETVGVRAGTVTVATRPIDVPTSAASTRPTAALLPAAELRFVIDRAGRRAALLAPPATAARIGISEGQSFPALVLFDGDRIYVRAPDASLVGARPWLAVDLANIGVIAAPETDELSRPRTAGDLAVVSPVQLIDLALGVLTGSLERESDGTYRARTSVEKEFRERGLEASDSDDLLDVLRSFAVKDDINPIKIALDASGGLRRVAVDFVGKPEYGVKLATSFALELDPADTPVDKTVLAAPKRADVVEVSTLGDVRAAIDEWTLTEVVS